MENLGFGQILFLALLILVPLVNFVMQRVRRRLEGQIPAEESVTQIRRQAQATPAPLPTPRASRNRVQVSQPPIVLTPLARRHFTKRSLLGTPRDVRRGIIVMAVLGPCRAFDPLGGG